MIAIGVKRSCLIWSAALLLAPALAWGAEASPGTAAQGHKLYLRYCSACHGDAGKGDGIVSGLMSPKPTDLTQLARASGGTFDAAAVRRSIDGRETVRAHGDPDMPVWGEVLTSEAGPVTDREAVVQAQVALITDYLASIQAK